MRWRDLLLTLLIYGVFFVTLLTLATLFIQCLIVDEIRTAQKIQEQIVLVEGQYQRIESELKSVSNKLDETNDQLVLVNQSLTIQNIPISSVVNALKREVVYENKYLQDYLNQKNEELQNEYLHRKSE